MDALSVSREANREELQQAHQDWARVHRPDVGGDAGLFREVTTAFQDAVREVRG